MVDCNDERGWDLYDVKSKEECCKKMSEWHYEAIGCDPLPTVAELLNSAENMVNTNMIYEKLVSLYMYRTFTLKNTRVTDRSAWCQHKGWSQGLRDSDCFIDSCMFALFGNDELSIIIAKKLDALYYKSRVDRFINEIVFCMSLYADLLASTRERSKIKVPNIEISFQNSLGETFILTLKQALKWCLLWYMCQSIKDKYGEDSQLYSDVIINGIALGVDLRNHDFDGSNPLWVMTCFNIILGIVEIDWNGDISHTYSAKTNPELINLVGEVVKKYRKGDIIIIPIYGLIPADRPFELLFYPRNARLEGFIKGTNKHVISFTRCGDKWLGYNNILPKTTETIEDNSKILERLRDTSIINMLVYRVL
jgi:hypothetical protein